jgi:hypothetical protein
MPKIEPKQGLIFRLLEDVYLTVHKSDFHNSCIKFKCGTRIEILAISMGRTYYVLLKYLNNPIEWHTLYKSEFKNLKFKILYKPMIKRGITITNTHIIINKYPFPVAKKLLNIIKNYANID